MEIVLAIIGSSTFTVIVSYFLFRRKNTAEAIGLERQNARSRVENKDFESDVAIRITESFDKVLLEKQNLSIALSEAQTTIKLKDAELNQTIGAKNEAAKERNNYLMQNEGFERRITELTDKVLKMEMKILNYEKILRANNIEFEPSSVS